MAALMPVADALKAVLDGAAALPRNRSRSTTRWAACSRAT